MLIVGIVNPSENLTNRSVQRQKNGHLFQIPKPNPTLVRIHLHSSSLAFPIPPLLHVHLPW